MNDFPPLPDFDLLDNAAAVLGVFETVNLYDAAIRAVRVALATAPTVEVDVHLPGSWAVAVPEADRPAEYRITFRSVDATSVHVDDLYTQNVVGEYGFEADPDGGDGRRFWIRGTVGCDIDVQSARVEVAGVEPVRVSNRDDG